MDAQDRDPVDLGDAPAEEGVGSADAARQVHEDPDEVPNLTEREDDPRIAEAAETWPDRR